MKKLMLSVAIAVGLTTGVFGATSTAKAVDVVAQPPNPLTGDPLTVLVTEEFGRDSMLLVSVQLHPPDPLAEMNPPEPDIEIVAPAQ
jgi:hypothetical protein